MCGQVERYNYLLDLLVSNHCPVLLAGIPGVGKTAIIQNLVLPKHTSSTLVMSHGLSAAMMRTSIIGNIHEIQSRAMGVVPGPGAGGATNQGPQRHLFFIDDLSMAPTVGGNVTVYCGCLFLAIFVLIIMSNILKEKSNLPGSIFPFKFYFDKPPFSPAQPCSRYSRAFNSSTRIVYLAVFK